MACFSRKNIVRLLAPPLAPVWLAALLVGLVGCGESSSMPLGEDAMVELLMDVHVAEAALAPLPPGPQKDSMAKVYYQEVMEINGVEQEEFDSSLAALRRNPKLMQSIFEEVNAELEKLKLGKKAEKPVAPK